MHHRVVSRKEKYYPFKPYWSCVCGHRFRATYMGPGKFGLEAEFDRHRRRKEAERGKVQAGGDSSSVVPMDPSTEEAAQEGRVHLPEARQQDVSVTPSER